MDPHEIFRELAEPNITDLVDETYANFEATGIWPAEVSVVTEALERVAPGQPITYDDKIIGLKALDRIIGKRPLSPELEERISAAADLAIYHVRRRAASFPGVYIFIDDIMELADSEAGGRIGDSAKSKASRAFPFSRVEFVVREKLGADKGQAPDADALLGLAVEARNTGEDAVKTFTSASGLKNTDWLFKDVNREDFRD